MSIYRVEVEVALGRPPRADATLYFAIEAESGYQAELQAQQWVFIHPEVVMPVGSVVTDW